jgi:hypothetical protein
MSNINTQNRSPKKTVFLNTHNKEKRFVVEAIVSKTVYRKTLSE